MALQCLSVGLRELGVYLLLVAIAGGALPKCRACHGVNTCIPQEPRTRSSEECTDPNPNQSKELVRVGC